MVDAWLCGKSSLNPALALLSLELLCAVSRFELIKGKLHYSPDSHQLLWGMAGRDENSLVVVKYAGNSPHVFNLSLRESALFKNCLYYMRI